jgi:hypothetical protein
MHGTQEAAKKGLICKTLIINTLENSSLIINELRFNLQKKLLNGLEIPNILRNFVFLMVEGILQL